MKWPDIEDLKIDYCKTRPARFWQYSIYKLFEDQIPFNGDILGIRQTGDAIHAMNNTLESFLNILY